MVGWQFLQEWNEVIGERMPISKDAAAEERELKNDRAKLFTQDIHRFQELRNFGIAVHQHFVVRDGLRNFDRKHEAIRRSSIPVFNRASGRTCVESRVNLDGVKSFGIEPEVVGRLHASRIEGAVPAGGGEGGGSKQNWRPIHPVEYIRASYCHRGRR